MELPFSSDHFLLSNESLVNVLRCMTFLHPSRHVCGINLFRSYSDLKGNLTAQSHSIVTGSSETHSKHELSNHKTASADSSEVQNIGMD